MKRSPLPPRSSSLPPGNGPSRRVPLRSVSARSEAARTAAAGADGAVTQRPPGFTRAVKLLIRTRAGRATPRRRRECCGTYLGRYGGRRCSHRRRGMGGTSNPVLGPRGERGPALRHRPVRRHGLARPATTGMRVRDSGCGRRTCGHPIRGTRPARRSGRVPRCGAGARDGLPTRAAFGGGRMNAPHRASAAATGVDLALVAALLGTAAWLAVAAVQRLRRPRRWPRPPKSWLRDFRAEARDRNGDDDQ